MLFRSQDNLPHARWTTPPAPSTAPSQAVYAHTHTSPLTPSTVPPPQAVYAHTRTSPLAPSTTPPWAVYAHAHTVGCAICTLCTGICTPCPLSPRWHPSRPRPLNRLHSRSCHSTANHHTPPLPTYPLTHTGTHVPHLPPQDNLPHTRCFVVIIYIFI